MNLNAKHTVRASYIGYLTQAITINFAPLLFVTFENTYGISMGMIGLLIGISFLTQLAADFTTAKIADRLNIRAAVIFAHICAVVGMTGFAFLPEIMPTPYLGLVIAVMIAAVGGGIIEVLVSPIVEAAPTENKSTQMSLLHSFYSWGLAGVVILSTLFFTFVGIEHWRLLSALWAIIPAVGAIAFCFVPIYKLEADASRENDQPKKLGKSGIFWIFIIMMFCAGAAEQVMGQWASSFAQTGLGINKTAGDILGPCLFAILMGSTRVFYGRSDGRIRLTSFIAISSGLCILSYIIAALSPVPIVSLLGCALCGLATGIMWPGTYSLASSRMPWGGVRMFAFLAMAGDMGCLVGPTAAGWIAEACNNRLQVAFLVSLIYPILMAVMLFLGFSKRKRSDR